MEELNSLTKKDFMKKRFIQYLWISFGVLLSDLGFYFFYGSISLCTGGVMGLSILFRPLYENSSWLSPSIFMYALNILCLILGLIFIGKDFFIKTIYATLLSPTIMLVLEKTIPADVFVKGIGDYINMESFGASTYIICTILGSILLGTGIGIAVKNNGSTGGMDVIQVICSKYFHMPYSFTLYFTDCIIVIVSGFLLANAGSFYNIEEVVFGIINVIIVSILIDKVVLNAYSRRTAYIVTDKAEAVKDVIYSTFDRGVTFAPVVGGYSGGNKTMVICTMDRHEAYKLREVILKVDSKAFMFISSCKEVVGSYGDKRIG